MKIESLDRCLERGQPCPRVGKIGFARTRLSALLSVLGVALIDLLTTPATGQPTPLVHAHAHNDYEHARPLLDALEHGFCSVEADIYLVDGKLLVAHDRDKVKPERTLQALYLEPLRERAKKNGGRVYPNGPGFSLMIDLKSDWKTTYPVLRALLADYADVLTSFGDGSTTTNAVTVVLSGNRDQTMFAGEAPRYAALDGFLSDLDANPPSALVPWISANWASSFRWRGAGAMAEADLQQLKTIVNRAHEQGRQVRFWGAPDNANFWQAMLVAGVDLINTDDLAGLDKFFAAGRESSARSTRRLIHLGTADYADRVQAIWTAQIAAVLMGFQFEHKVASTMWVDRYPKPYDSAPVDDDWYYEMCAVRAFEKHGIGLTVEQLGEQWKENNCGSWGSSEQARLNLAKGIKAPDTGHPRYNKLWFTIGPQFSADVYGALAPGLPNLAGKLARQFGHVNGYAEAVDGAVFMAGMVSLGFVESDPKVVVRKAARLIHTDSPFRQCLDMIMAMAEAGKSPQEIAGAVEDRWHIEYPATNNSVPNGGLAAIGVWFGEGDFLKTVNIIYRAADFTDADCNAANAAAVIAAMHGMKCLPANLVEPLHDRIAGSEMGRVKLTPPVDEKISELAQRTVKVGMSFLATISPHIDEKEIAIPVQEPVTQPAELFALGDLTKYWNPDWKLERAGVGGAGGGIGNMRGNTHLEGDVLATWPRDPVRGVVLRRTAKLSDQPSLVFQVAADPARAWELEVYAGNQRLFRDLIDGGAEKSGDRKWREIKIDLKEFAGKEIQLRLYQHVLLADRIPGNAYWKGIELK